MRDRTPTGSLSRCLSAEGCRKALYGIAHRVLEGYHFSPVVSSPYIGHQPAYFGIRGQARVVQFVQQPVVVVDIHNHRLDAPVLSQEDGPCLSGQNIMQPPAHIRYCHSLKSHSSPVGARIVAANDANNVVTTRAMIAHLSRAQEMP